MHNNLFVSQFESFLLSLKYHLSSNQFIYTLMRFSQHTISNLELCSDYL